MVWDWNVCLGGFGPHESILEGKLEVIGVIDYQAGNSTNVVHALRRVGVESQLVSTPTEVLNSERLILPGVGAARATMDSLQQLDLIGALESSVLENLTPFLGVCIGHQILFERSEEGDTPCLGWLKGEVRRFETTALPVPQIGWNEVHFQSHPVVRELPPSSHFYFVNSYYAVPADSSMVIGDAEYESPFCSMVAKGNVFGAQFHVEKSGPYGLRLLHAFATLEEDSMCLLDG